jgi:hypothetical protein
MSAIIHEPISAHGAGGIVTLNGPEGIVATMSVEIARLSAANLIKAAEAASSTDEEAIEE